MKTTVMIDRDTHSYLKNLAQRHRVGIGTILQWIMEEKPFPEPPTHLTYSQRRKIRLIKRLTKILKLRMGMKKCCRCKTDKPIKEFWKNQSACRKCLGYKDKRYDTEKERMKGRRESMLRYYYRNQIARNMSNRIRQSLKGLTKSKRWESLVGYTLDELKEHLSSSFQPRMTWENFGQNGWHIHHIKPIHKFNITSDDCEDFKECWSLENLRPIWEKDHLKLNGKDYDEMLLGTDK